MKRILIAAALLVFLCSCAQPPAPMPTNTATTEPTTTQTPLPSPTPTITPEPTKSPAQIAAGLEGLNQERTYIVRGEYLVDTYNQAPKAVLQGDGTWRALDYENAEESEVMYGHLVPKDAFYLDDEVGTWSDGSRGYTLQMVYLGEVIWEVAKYSPDRNVDVAYLLVGLRDDKGDLHMGKYGVDAPDAGRPHWFSITGLTPGGESYDNLSCGGGTIVELMGRSCWIKPGAFVLIKRFPDPNEKVEEIDFKPISDEYPLSGGFEATVAEILFNQNKDNMMTSEEWLMISKGFWPKRVVEMYSINGLQVLSSPTQP